MFVSNNARQLINSWRSFCRGVGVAPPPTDEVYVLAEYAVEKMGKRDYNKAVGDYFRADGKPNLDYFLRSTGFNINRVDPRRMAAESLYILLCRDLFVTDWAPPSKSFLTTDLYEVGVQFLPVAPAAIVQCVNYSGRHWAYFKVVASQAVAVQQCEDAMEAERLDGQRLPAGYIEAFHTTDAATAAAHKQAYLDMKAALESHIEDQRIGRANAEKD